jgi:tricorn protease
MVTKNLAMLLTLLVLLALQPALVISPVAAAQAAPGYYRFPTIGEDVIVFTAEGDLWIVGIEGGMARRLTTHHGTESHAAISPDGTTLAFSAQYEGPTEVYTMPLVGGVPERETYWGEPCRVVGWTPDGRIIYSTRHYSTLPNTQLAACDPGRDEHEVISLSQASEGVYDPSGNTLFFTRQAFQGSHTKRYRGGTAQNIWRFSDGDIEARALTGDYPGASRSPMWWDDRIYFASDRDGTVNIWSMSTEGADLRQHTFHKGWDVKSPALSGGRIVYQLGADLYLYDISAGDDHMVPISLASDFDQRRTRWVKKPVEYLTEAHISPDGDRVVLAARGRLFVVPARQGRFVEATREAGVRYRSARFMPDGETVLVLSDKTGELEFWEIPASGVGSPKQLTDDGDVFRFQGIPSPDGTWIAYTDKNQKMWLYNKRTRRTVLVAASDQATPYDLAWSVDSRWLAYVAEAENYYPQIMLYDTKQRSTTSLTGDRVDSYSPTWSPDGKWLYFLSDRYFVSLTRSPWGPRQPEPCFDKTTKIYHVALTTGLRSPFKPDDETEQEADDQDSETDSEARNNEKNKPEEAKATEVEIDLDGIEARIMEVPVPAGNYRNLAMTETHLFWTEAITGPEAKRHLAALKLANEDIESKTIVEDIKGYELSLDGEKLMIRKQDDVYVVDASGAKPDDLSESRVDLSNWTFAIDPREEWRQMLTEAWRLQRDYFYDPGLHGVDWDAQLARHLPLVERVSDREELSDVISQMISELSALHLYIWGGDRRRGEDEIEMASLGADLRRDEGAGGYRVGHIYRSDPDYPTELSPLAQPGIDIEEDDIIEAINGVPTLSVSDPALLLKNQAGRQVLLTVKSMPGRKIRDVIVEPITARQTRDLRYREWEHTRRLRVEESGDGEIGYVHLRAMTGRNIAEWVRSFYPVYNRKGLIVDVRHNVGGNIDSWILEKLMRRAWFYWKPRVGAPYWNMQYAFRGHMVVLCDEWTMSDGEAFTEGFKRLGLGKVIGTRTWGGEIWLSSSNFVLVDKGVATSAQSGVYAPEGEWIIEGHGVEPDFVVDNMPHATFVGQDAQLEAAIAHLKEQIRLDPVGVPPAPAYPDKSFDY